LTGPPPFQGARPNPVRPARTTLSGWPDAGHPGGDRSSVGRGASLRGSEEPSGSRRGEVAGNPLWSPSARTNVRSDGLERGTSMDLL